MPPNTIIEVALNGPWGRGGQPGIPIAVEEIVAEAVACARAGASVIHVHSYNPSTGRQNDDPDAYAAVIKGVRAQIPDANIYPTIPLAGSDLSGNPASAKERFAHVEALARQALIEMTVVDPGSVNFTRIDGEELAPGFTYLNPEEHILHGLRISREAGLRSSFAVYEPGFTRLGAVLARRFKGLKTPIYRFMFSDAFAWGFPPRRYALEAHLRLLQDVAPEAPWMVAGLGVDIRPLVAEAVALGGHVRVGLEDAPFGCARANRELVEEAARLVRAAGGEPATAQEAREILAAHDRG